MSLQVLVSTMHQIDDTIVNRMNINSNAIIINQCNKTERKSINLNSFEIQFMSFPERGVGLSRNNALMRATSEFCLIADDDLILNKNYKNIVENCFKENPSADVLIFNLYEDVRTRYVNQKKFKVNYLNFMKYGATRIAFRRKSITKNGITFNLNFGGGTQYSAGEDTLFLNDCLQKGLNIYAVPNFIGTLTNDRESTWFEGYNDKFFLDRGVLFAALSKKSYFFLCLQFCIRHGNKYKADKSRKEILKLMLKGAKQYKELK
ncbi:glycosyltransferase family 2 protein [Planococcus halotolerans]|uniref:glycosyltransferase family 2 protein n=1 Tax=Planococcus halotolerans TaxID=2233542 RepID=UPI001091FF54|nr:glycosyltransferase family A protein [Planococcus halotolerans]QHJ70550.1 hypothetical protein DNR44_007990 [Planococcus halotolerans]